MTRIPISAALLFCLAAVPARAQFLTPPHDGTNNINCLACHVPHGEPWYDYKNPAGNVNLCKSCHNPSGVGDINTHSPGGVDMKCSTCHNPHRQDQQLDNGSGFSKLIRTVIATPNSGSLPVVLMAPTGPNSFADGDGVYDGVCEVCHTTTDYHRNDPSGDHTHNAAQDCRQCHPHMEGFLPSCKACHNQTQPPGLDYRRQVVQNGADGQGDFLRFSHHVDDGGGGETVLSQDCVVCHDQSGHQGWSDPDVLLKDPDGGASHQFDGTGASIEAFCLGCHDADGEGGNLTPFTDGQTPTDIAASWNLTPAHAASPFGITCWTCHQNGHGSDNPSLNAALEEALCFSCHDGSVAAVDVQAEFARTYRHPIAAQSFVHADDEDPLTMGRHVECVDCHDPHAADGTLPWTAPGVPGVMVGAQGIDTDGAVVDPVVDGYEVCYACHADTTPASPALSRYLVEANVRNEFDLAQPSFHPIEGPGQNPDVPSLINGWTTGSVMVCWDCHAGGDGAPHGADYPWILKLRYETADNTSESSSVYALCYSCHSRTNILNDNSFGEHNKHIVGERTPCSVCHDAHASTAHVQNPSGNHLINFRTGIVTANSNGDLYFRDDGTFRGACSLRCHGQNHSNENY